MTDMTMRIWPAVAAAGALFGPGATVARELWNHTQLGMTPTQVQSVFPQAAPGEPTWNRDDMKLRVPALRAGGHDATAYLDFTGEGLRAVKLVLSPDHPGGTINTDEVKAQLSAKYGAPDRCDPEPEECEWGGAGIEITLKAVRARSGDKVAVLYAPSKQAAATAGPRAPTPVDVVRAFYSDLADGDGEQASLLVVPEKRGRGPYSPGALTGFYSSLPEPIRLLAAYPHDGSSVFVRYRFESRRGHTCDGKADVRTIWVGDRLLIEAIHSYSGC